jgi:hypothetical protein
VHYVAVVLFIVDVKEMRDEFGDVFGPLTQRGQINGNYVKPIVQILSE